MVGDTVCCDTSVCLCTTHLIIIGGTIITAAATALLLAPGGPGGLHLDPHLRLALLPGPPAAAVMAPLNGT